MVSTLPSANLSEVGVTTVTIGEAEFKVHIIDSTDTYTELMKSLFNFEQI